MLSLFIPLTHSPSGADRIIRASRHYERAGQILTRKAVATAKKYIQGLPGSVLELGQPVTVYAPARVDLAGGWTDTPPQAYEWGGVVTTLSLNINGKVCVPCRYLGPCCQLTTHPLFSLSVSSQSSGRENS